MLTVFFSSKDALWSVFCSPDRNVNMFYTLKKFVCCVSKALL